MLIIVPMNRFILDDKHPVQYKQYNPNHIVIDNFLNLEEASRIEEAFLEVKPNEKWYQYDNLFERKVATDKLTLMPEIIRQALYDLNSQVFINYLETLTGIEGLIPDPHLRGGGIHLIPETGFLDIHADRSIHPKLNLYRRVNVLIYFNRNYKKEHGGQFELWSHEMDRCLKVVEPIFNRAMIFNTDAKSYHGHPNPWNHSKPRMSIATYYFTSTIPPDFPCNPESTDFRARPGDPLDEVKDRLRQERKQLRING